MSTGLTRYHNLPYPTSQRVRGNGAADIETLAVKTDTELDGIGTQWTTVYKPDSSISTISSMITGVLPNNLFTAFNFGATSIWGNLPPAPGWFAITAAIACIPSGAVTSNSRRTMVVNVLGDTGSSVPVNSFMREDYEAGGVETILEVDFVAFLGPRFTVQVTFIHANVASNMNILTQSTYLAMNRLIGAT